MSIPVFEGAYNTTTNGFINSGTIASANWDDPITAGLEFAGALEIATVISGRGDGESTISLSGWTSFARVASSAVGLVSGANPYMTTEWFWRPQPSSPTGPSGTHTGEYWYGYVRVFTGLDDPSSWLLSDIDTDFVTYSAGSGDRSPDLSVTATADGLRFAEKVYAIPDPVNIDAATRGTVTANDGNCTNWVVTDQATQWILFVVGNPRRGGWSVGAIQF